MDTPVNLHVLKNDGEGQKATEPVITAISSCLHDIANDYRANVHGNRYTAHRSRLCLWDNQDDSGLKIATDSFQPFPFNGASDIRLRLADTVINVLAAMCSEATRRSADKVEGVTSADGKLAGNMRSLLRWVIRNQLGIRWDREITRAAQWMLGDQPGVSIMGVYWHQEYGIQNETKTITDLTTLVANFYAETGQGVDPAFIQKMLMDEADEPLAIEILSQTFEGVLQDKTIRRILRSLRDTGAATYPVPVVLTNTPRICAHRVMDDIFIPPNTEELERARYIFVREWLSEVELRERINTHGYDQAFVDKVIGPRQPGQTEGGYEGQSFLSLETLDQLQNYSNGAGLDTTDDHKGTYEVITSYFRALNDDGVPGIYYLPFHAGAKAAAHDQKLLDYAHGRYPFVLFSREHISKRVLDARGIAWLAMTDQALLKRHTDGFSDYTMMKTLKPLATPANRPSIVVNAAPLAINKVVRPGEIAPLDIAGDAPQTLPQMLEILDRRVAAYFGLPHAAVPEMITQVLNQNLVSNFLASVSEVCMQIVQLCQQYMDDDTVTLATGTQTSDMRRTRADIQGRFQVTLAQNAVELNPDYFIRLAEVIGKTILPIDVGAAVERSKLVTYLLRGIDPSLAESVVRPQEDADQSEVEDEQKNLALIAAGVEPTMKESGQNHKLRLQVLESELQRNPMLAQRMASQPDSIKILDARRKHLHFVGVEQVQNAQIGRVGARPALEQGV